MFIFTQKMLFPLHFFIRVCSHRFDCEIYAFFLLHSHFNINNQKWHAPARFVFLALSVAGCNYTFAAGDRAAPNLPQAAVTQPLAGRLCFSSFIIRTWFNIENTHTPSEMLKGTGWHLRGKKDAPAVRKKDLRCNLILWTFRATACPSKQIFRPHFTSPCHAVKI